MNLQKRRLTDRQRELLAHVRVDGNLAVFAKDEQIPDWAALKTVLTTLGGKWRRGSKAKAAGFVFEDECDASEIVRIAQETGEIFDPKLAGFFETPDELADQIAAVAMLRPHEHVFEPSAGRGALLRAAFRAERLVQVTWCELLRDNADALIKQGFVHGWTGDFLSYPLPSKHERFDDMHYLEQAKLADVVLMNPPFAKGADIDHITRALKFVRPKGRLVAIASAGVTFRQDKKTQAFRELLERQDARIVPNPEGSFQEAGTMVSTVTIFCSSVVRS